MLTVEKLPKNHRRVYEALRDAQRALSPDDLVEITGLGGSTVRGTVRAMDVKGLLRRVEYGLYVAVPLDEVAKNRAKEKGSLSDKTPIANQSNDALVGQGWPDYSVGVRVVRPNPEEDVTLPPEWAMPIIIAAAGIIFDRVDVDRARTAKEEGRKYRLRLLVEELPEPDKTEPPDAQAK